MRWILDTNVLIYALTDHPDFAPRIRAAFAEARAQGIVLYIPVAVVAEALYVLEGPHFRYTRREAADALEAAVVAPGVECQDAGPVLFGLHRHRETGLDFVDGYCAGLARHSGGLLLTHDRGIARRTGAPVRHL